MQDSLDGQHDTGDALGIEVGIEVVQIPAAGGVHLAATLYRPPGDGPFATLVEALPYRMHDVTASYADSYWRFAAEGGFAVLHDGGSARSGRTRAGMPPRSSVPTHQHRAEASGTVTAGS